MIKPRFYSKWHKLTDVMLGTTYPHEYYDGLEDNIRDPLLQLTDETLEDLEHFENVLKQFGCNVIRPTVSKASIKEWIEQNQIMPTHFSQSVRPPLQVRDAQLVIGDKLVFVSTDNKDIRTSLLQHINSRNIMMHPNVMRKTNLSNPMHSQSPYGEGSISATELTVLGKTILIESLEQVEKGKWTKSEQRLKDIEWFIKKLPEYDWYPIEEGGHTDAQWHMIKPGVALSLPGLDSIDDLLTENIDVCYLNTTDFSTHDSITKSKWSMSEGQWWLPGEESNLDLINFINKWMSQWTGEMQETVFDVNILVLDDKHICINKSNKTLETFLKKHNMEPIVVPWRHRYFWDGGLHCITLDLRREGPIEDYSYIKDSLASQKLTMRENR